MKKAILFIALSCLTLSLVVFWLSNPHNVSGCQHLNTLKIPLVTKQIVLVESKGGIIAQLSTCIWNQRWKSDLFHHPIPAVLGKQGLAALGTKKEGDGKTPTGLYPIESAFGTQPLALKMDFKFITSEAKFIDDPKHPQYNSWVDGATTAQSYELMDHPLYKMGAIISYSCYARSILSCHIFKLLPSNLVRSKNQFVLNSKVI
ncbi:hypothetical protein [Legionella sp. km772]|uniref:hypothetical protein n=1 Tax=Legionella sp. km772 TaxID=2498111 RepID=UPI000F8D36BC|nr:hypothetical protein [Legionella sp. km772]RUR05515.1 hypothetical protein ELY15_14235 [Legionella sp. km772]